MSAYSRVDIGRWFSKNKGVLAAFFAVYIFALAAGVLCVPVLDAQQSSELLKVYESVVLKASDFKIDFSQIYFAALKINMKYLFLIFVSGFAVLGAPFAAIFFAGKAFFLGLAFGSMCCLCPKGGVYLSFCSVFMQNMFSLPIMLLYAAICAKFSFMLYQNAKGTSAMKDDFASLCASYTAKFVIFSVLTASFSLAECFFVTIFL